MIRVGAKTRGNNPKLNYTGKRDGIVLERGKKARVDTSIVVLRGHFLYDVPVYGHALQKGLAQGGVGDLLSLPRHEFVG